MKLTALSKVGSKIGQFATKHLGKTALKLRKVAPEACLVLGIGAGIGCVVVACVQTTKLDKVTDTAKEHLDDIHKTREENPEEYTEELMKKDTVKVYATSAKDIIKLYALPAGLGGLSVLLLVHGHRILRKENAALAAAYVGLSESFRKYRDRVIQKEGQEADYEYMYSKGTDVIELDENGEPIGDPANMKVEKRYDTTGISSFARFFDRGNVNWCKSPEATLMFLKGVQNYCNDKFHVQGHLFVNDVYEELGIPKTSEGQFFGWIDNEDGTAFIDFGLYTNNPQTRAFINGDEEAVLLDFYPEPQPILWIFDKTLAKEDKDELRRIVKNPPKQ